MTNPNNCATCKHKQNADGGWCYMFRDEPTDVCGIHSRRGMNTTDAIRQLIKLLPKEE